MHQKKHSRAVTSLPFLSFSVPDHLSRRLGYCNKWTNQFIHSMPEMLCFITFNLENLWMNFDFRLPFIAYCLQNTQNLAECQLNKRKQKKSKRSQWTSPPIVIKTDYAGIPRRRQHRQTLPIHLSEPTLPFSQRAWSGRGRERVNDWEKRPRSHILCNSLDATVLLFTYCEMFWKQG